MKIIDLLNKISNGEEVPKVIKKQWKYEWQYDGTRDEYVYMQETGERFDNDWLVINILNDEVEIIEDKKIEKLDRCAVVSGDLGCEWSFTEKILKDKINEIIDKINGDK